MKWKRKRGAIIFDFDGTLADSFPVAMDIFYALTKVERLAHPDVTRLRDMTLLQVAKELRIPMYKVPFLLLGGRGAMHGRMHEIELIPGIDRLIRKLHRRHTLFVLSSNSSANIELLLRAHGLENCFSAIYGDVSLLGKTQKLRRIIRQQKLDKKHIWLVGDEARDIDAAHRVGVKAAAVSWGYNSIGALKRHQPEALVFTVEELEKCLKHNKSDLSL